MPALFALRVPPTAVFRASDHPAFGAHKACAIAGVPLLGELSTFGCDDIDPGILVKQFLVRMLVASCGLVAIAYVAMFVTATPPTWAAISLAIGANGVIMSLMALGAVRRDTMPRSLMWTFLGLFVLCAGCFVVALLLPAQEGAGGPLFLGLPIRTAIVLYGVGVVPIAILPFAYAFTFEWATLSDEDLARVRAARAGIRSGDSS